MQLSFLTSFLNLCLFSQLRLTDGLEDFIWRKWTKCAPPGTHYSLRSGLTFQQCVTECVNRLECQTLSYRIQEHVCMFLRTHEPLIKNTNTNGRCFSVRRAAIVNAPMVAADSPCQCAAWETCDPVSGNCSKRECGVFSISNGRFLGNMNVIGARVKFSCNSGFTEVNGITRAECLEHGVWSYIPQCGVNVCGEPPTVANAVIADGGYLPGNTRQYKCIDNYRTFCNDVDMVTACLTDGSWKSVNFICIWDGDCPVNFVKYDGSCYLITNNKYMDWQESRDYCKAMSGSHLVHVDNQNESDLLTSLCGSQCAGSLAITGVQRLIVTRRQFLWLRPLNATAAELLRSVYRRLHQFWKTRYWINLSDISSEDDWVWGDTNTTADYTNWGSGEPNSYLFDNYEEDCAILYQHVGYKWADIGCQFKGELICELK